MAQYRWHGTNIRGRQVSGTLQAKNKQEARTILRRQAIVASRIVKQLAWPRIWGKHKITSNHITLFFTQLATLLESGVALLQSLHIIKNNYRGHPFEALIDQIIERIASGNPFSVSLSQHPRYFEPLVYNLIKTGEVTGNLAQLTRQISNYRTRKAALLSKVKKALYYPVTVILFALIITLGLLLFVIPQFEQLFASFGAELPAVTKAIIRLASNIEQHGWLVLCLVTLVLSVSWRIISGSEKLLYQKDRVVLTFPIVGKLIRQVIITRFCQTLGLTLKAGVPIHQGVYFATKATDNRHYQHVLKATQLDVESGTALSQSLEATGQFPELVIKLIAIGEESGSMDEMLERLHYVFSQDLDEQIDGLMSLLEPVIIVFLGSMIGALVMAMYLPIFEIVKVV